jgi:Flp pilus assembly protein TadG
MMTTGYKGARAARSLFRDERGSTYAIAAAYIIPLFGFVGLGLDLGRGYMTSSRLQSSVDIATLAAVRIEQLYPGAGSSPGPKTVDTVNQFLTANMPLGYVGATRQTPQVAVTRAGDEVTVQVTVEGTVPTTLMQIFGIPTMPVKASAKGIAGKTLPTAVETMLVLDVTGSMDSNGGMTALKDSMGNFLDIVYGTQETRTNFAIGVLPYAVFANVGRLLPDSMVQEVPGYTDKAFNNAYGWKGCVFADPTIRNLSNDINAIDANTYDMGKTLPGENGMPQVQPAIYPPLWVYSFHRQDNRYKLGATSGEAFNVANYAPMRTALIRRYGNNICQVSSGNNSDAACNSSANTKIKPSRLPDYANWPAPRYYDATVKPSNADDYVSKSPSYVCPTQALPISYSRTKTELTNYKNSLQPLFNIGTWHVPAMTWGYRLLARQDAFARARPGNMGLRRVMVFMTDGNFDSNDNGSTVASRGSGYNDFERDSAYTAYQSYADRKVVNQWWGSGSSNTSLARAAHRDQMALRFAKTCQAMKNEGIEIYTITFAIAAGAEGDATREMFKQCATNRNTHFFETKDPSQLRIAFTSIAANLIDLHLAK